MTTLAVDTASLPVTAPARLEHQPALDGLRGLAVLAVLLYHLSGGADAGPLAGALPGGYLGVDVFFVLSGYLITSLLLVDHTNRGRVVSTDFWLRRIRRLLPPVIVLLVMVSAYAWLTAGSWQLSTLRSEGLATLFYAQNWYLIYGDPVGGNMGHTWSLAIEEQWYLIWPFALAGLLLLFRERRSALIAAVTGLALLSAAWMSVLASRGELHRAHSGTDTRASELLVGAGLALVMSRIDGPRNPAGRFALETAGLLALAALVGMMFVLDDGSTWLLHGGYLLVAVLSAVVVAACVQARSKVLRRGLGFGMLASVGLISYALYLYHLPLIVWVTPTTVGLTGAPLLLLRLVVVFGAAIASYVLIEGPLRRTRIRPRNALLMLPALAAAAVLLVVSTRTVGANTQVDKVASFSQRAADTAPSGSQRILVVGDYSVYSLARAGGAIHDDDRTRGLAMTLLLCDGMPGRPMAGGRPVTSLPCVSWRDNFVAERDGFEPDVAVLALGSWLALDRRIGGVVRSPGSPELETLYLDRLEAMRRVLTTGGRPLVLLAPSCGIPPSSPIAARAWLETVWRAFAAAHADSVTYADPGPAGCPPPSAGSTEMRTPSGALTPSGATAMRRWLASVAPPNRTPAS